MLVNRPMIIGLMSLMAALGFALAGEEAKKLYKSTMDCAMQIMKNEGLRATSLMLQTGYGCSFSQCHQLIIDPLGKIKFCQAKL